MAARACALVAARALLALVLAAMAAVLSSRPPALNIVGYVVHWYGG